MIEETAYEICVVMDERLCVAKFLHKDDAKTWRDSRSLSGRYSLYGRTVIDGEVIWEELED